MGGLALPETVEWTFQALGLLRGAAGIVLAVGATVERYRRAEGDKQER